MQGSVIWHVAEAEALGARVDYVIDLKTGAPIGKLEDQIRSVIVGLVRAFGDISVKDSPVRVLLEAGLAPCRP